MTAKQITVQVKHLIEAQNKVDPKTAVNHTVT
jgi:hypothetical protein